MRAVFVSPAALRFQPQEDLPMIRSLLIVTALCLYATSASALTMEECRAKYKAEQAKDAKAGVGMSWVDYQQRECGISAKVTEPKPPPAAPAKH
jgi:hypothetical protein